MPNNAEALKRGTGLLVIEVVNSNPNGDPDQESDPRLRIGDIGEISPVSFKRKLRDLIEDPQSATWTALEEAFPGINKNDFGILESRGRDRKKLAQNGEKFTKMFWDVRVFGSTFLQEKANAITSGVVQFGMGVSIAPVEVRRLTLTNKSGVQDDKDRGMAPLGYRVVQHGVYVMPFFVNASMAKKSDCTPLDIQVLLRLIPLAYSQTASCMRPDVRIRCAWYIEHKSVLGSCPDYLLLEALQPTKKDQPDKPSSSWSDYTVPASLPPELEARISRCTDLIKPLAVGA